MEIKNIKSRNILFTDTSSGDWGVNIHLIKGRKNNYIIDTGLGSLSVLPVTEYIKHDNKQTIVINTHFHWDHIWGNSYFQDHTIISHKLCRGLIQSNWDYAIQKYSRYFNGEVKICLPNLVFEKELYFPEDKIRLIYTPGHTTDSISVIDEEEKILNAGDNIGDTVSELVPSLLCKKDVYIDTLLGYKDLDFDTCISGHNVVLGKEAIDEILRLLYSC